MDRLLWFRFPQSLLILNFLFAYLLFIFVTHSVSMAEKLPGSDLYDNFAFDTTDINSFVRDGSSKKSKSKRRSSGPKSGPFKSLRHSIDLSLHSFSGRVRSGLDFSGHSGMRSPSIDGSNKAKAFGSDSVRQ